MMNKKDYAAYINRGMPKKVLGRDGHLRNSVKPENANPMYANSGVRGSKSIYTLAKKAAAPKVIG